MVTNPNNMENALATLGQARRDGVFSAQPGQYPWQVAAKKKAEKRGRRLGWIRVAVSLAAAAAIAVLFISPNFTKSRQSNELASSLSINAPSETAQHLADAEKSTSNAATFDCDYNGDGVVDGRDIQAFVDRLKDIHGDARLQAEFLQKCLLGS